MKRSVTRYTCEPFWSHQDNEEHVVGKFCQVSKVNGSSQLSVTHYNHLRVLKKMMPFKSEPLKEQPEHWNV